MTSSLLLAQLFSSSHCTQAHWQGRWLPLASHGTRRYSKDCRAGKTAVSIAALKEATTPPTLARRRAFSSLVQLLHH